ncbi:hypothetical protein N2152v2_001124 [Parachlorella kessleri]
MAAEAGKRQPSAQMTQFLVQEQAKAQLQQTVARLTDECFDKCVGNPGNYLSSREQACLDNCSRRFLETTQFVVKYFQVRVVMQSVLLCPLRTSFVVGVPKLVAAGIEVDNVLQSKAGGGRDSDFH